MAGLCAGVPNKHFLQEKKDPHSLPHEMLLHQGEGRGVCTPEGMRWEPWGTAAPASGCVLTSSKEVRGLWCALAAPEVKLVPCEVPAKHPHSAGARAAAF